MNIKDKLISLIQSFDIQINEDDLDILIHNLRDYVDVTDTSDLVNKLKEKHEYSLLLLPGVTFVRDNDGYLPVDLLALYCCDESFRAALSDVVKRGDIVIQECRAKGVKLTPEKIRHSAYIAKIMRKAQKN